VAKLFKVEKLLENCNNRQIFFLLQHTDAALQAYKI